MKSQKSIEYNPETGTYRTTYQYPSRPPSIAVPHALTAVTDNKMVEFEPFYDATDVDPDALDTLFHPSSGGKYQEDRMTFTYHEHTITVKRNRRIVIQPPPTQRK